MTSFDLEDVDLGSPNLHHKEFLWGPTPQFRVFSISGSRDSRGAEYAPPSRARNSQTLSRGRVKLHHGCDTMFLGPLLKGILPTLKLDHYLYLSQKLE